MGVLRSFCRSLKLHKRASSLAWRRRRRTEGVLLWKTTSFLCFHIAQQHKWMKLWWWSREIVGGEWSRRGKWPSESLQYVRQGCSRMRWLLGIWTKCDLSLHQLSDIHTSQVALVTIFFFLSRFCLWWILFWTRVQMKTFTFGSEKGRYISWRVGWGWTLENSVQEPRFHISIRLKQSVRFTELMRCCSSTSSLVAVVWRRFGSCCRRPSVITWFTVFEEFFLVAHQLGGVAIGKGAASEPVVQPEVFMTEGEENLSSLNFLLDRGRPRYDWGKPSSRQFRMEVRWAAWSRNCSCARWRMRDQAVQEWEISSCSSMWRGGR
jgi:hypothetical protein